MQYEIDLVRSKGGRVLDRFSYRFRLLEGERDVLLHDAPGVDGHAGVVRHGLSAGLPD